MCRKKVCEFRANNIKDNPLTTIELEFFNGSWWYITFKGERSYKYISLAEAKIDIISMYSNYKDFRMLI